MRHIMVDIETLGTTPGSVILSIGACEFADAEITSRFYRPIDVFSSLMAGLTVDTATVGWWRMQSAEARGALQPGVPLCEALGAFTEYLSGSEKPLLWAKGPDFDLVLLQAAYAALGKKAPWSYRSTRDVRTILSLAPGVEGRDAATSAHHALHDAEYQATQVQAAALQIGVSLGEMA